MKYLPDLSLRLGILLLILVIPSTIYYNILLEPTLNITSFILHQEHTIIGNTVYIGNFALTFIAACIGIVAYLLLAILIFTTKSISWTKRLSMLILGSVLIFIANIVRIIILTNILLHNEPLFRTWHVLFWDVFSTLYVFLLWLILIRVFEIHTIPVYSDLKTLWQNQRKFKP